MKKTLTGISNFCILLSILVTPLLIIYKIDKLDTRIEQPKIIVYQVDNAGAAMVGKITNKQVIDRHYTVTVDGYGNFLVTKEQYEAVKVGDKIPDFLRVRK